MRKYSLKEKIGAFSFDIPRYIWCLLIPNGWSRMRNRKDDVRVASNGEGIACEWEYTRTIHLCDVFPVFGQWLMKWALQQYPIKCKPEPEHHWGDDVYSNGSEQSGHDPIPQVSFLVGHRGVERLPLLLWTLQSIAAQEQLRFECIVIEQSHAEEIRDALPSWVRYAHQKVNAGIPYNRSATFNMAASMARAPLLIFHDNDMLVPSCYGKEALELSRQGYEVVNLKRFIFYINQASTRLFAGSTTSSHLAVDFVLENAKGGGSIAVDARSFDRIGQFDEAFVGWGGEDLEFWDRCATCKVWNFAHLPFLHLWHPPQAGKRAVDGLGSHTAALVKNKLDQPVSDRISGLRGK